MDEVLRTALAERQPNEPLEQALRRVVGSRFGAASGQVADAIEGTVRAHASFTGTTFDEAAAQIAAGEAELSVQQTASSDSTGQWSSHSESVAIRSTTTGGGLKSLPPELRSQLRDFIRSGGDPTEMPATLHQEVASQWEAAQQARKDSRRVGCLFGLLATCRALLSKP